MSGLATQAAPSIFFPFGATDTNGIGIVLGQTFQLRKILVASFETTTFALAALAAPVTYTVYCNGVQVASLSSNATAPFWTVTETTIFAFIQQGDALAVVPGAAAGASRSVCVTLGGLWV